MNIHTYMHEIMKEQSMKLKKSRNGYTNGLKQEKGREKCFYIKFSIREFSIMEFYNLKNGKGSDYLNCNFLKFT